MIKISVLEIDMMLDTTLIPADGLALELPETLIVYVYSLSPFIH